MFQSSNFQAPLCPSQENGKAELAKCFVQSLQMKLRLEIQQDR